MIQRRSELVLLTHWPYDVLDRQPREDLDELLLYSRLKGAAQQEADDVRNSSATRPKRTGGR